MEKMKIAIGCDHAGFEYKEKLKKFLQKHGMEVIDLGTYGDASVDYPDFAHPVALEVEERGAIFGILICGSGNGVAIAANKHQGIRAALCWRTELARLARAHNDANVLCIPARFVSYGLAKKMTETFLKEKFENGRHQNRVNKISC
ncbi:MAG: ribose 5-phosphate isomerase B [Saprospiraceae bacterium]|nr:ribose 5-phosphate isomerase B [Saprospiraceae bacterium]